MAIMTRQKILLAALALLITSLLYLVATGAINAMIALDRQTQWYGFLGMAGVTVVLWIRLILIWRRRAAQSDRA